MRKIILGSLALLLLDCFSGAGEAGYPLYPHGDGATLPREKVALLVGAVESVDGERVAQFGHSFALLPGCHEVTNLQHWGGADNVSASMATLPELHYSIPMREGFNYILDVAGGGGRVSISAREQDANGQVTQSFEPGAPCPAG
ncbi:MAG TPA: hypothetical protein VK745_06585 [Polyangiaceae bacterium]|jgi:hypothetical protein|nr:hypothetical protein [Polyangiaceae bacterium]